MDMSAPGFAFLERLPLHRYQERLLKVARAIVGNRAEAQDVVQEAWLRLLETTAEGRGPFHSCNPSGGNADAPGEPVSPAVDTTGDQVYAWLCCVCRRLALEVLRKRGRGRDRGPGFLLEPAAPADPSAEVERREERELVRRVLRRLPARQVQLLRMRAYDCSYRQTAAAVGVADAASVGYLTVRARSAFIAMKRRLDRERR
jgi:DNA-directed RNA polymerase specialized sigma24 family protein